MRAPKKSFHAEKNANRPAVRIPGRSSGSIDHKLHIGPAPSISAASQISVGIEFEGVTHDEDGER